jgi:predicted nucleic acid-binding protein
VNSRRVVLLDACILINLFHGECFELLDILTEYDFRVTTHVKEEIIDSEQAFALEDLIKLGVVSTVSVTDDQTNLCIERLMCRLDAGEASCIAVAISTGWFIGTDDSLAIKIAGAEMGSGKILTTPGLIEQAIRKGLISVDKADEIKKRLEEYRFRMSFESFHDIV